MDFEKFALQLLGFILLLPVWFAGVMYSGFVVVKMWLWFVVPVGVQPLTNKWHAAGLMMVLGWPTIGVLSKLIDIPVKPDVAAMSWIYRAWINTLSGFVVVTAAWGFAYAYHQLMTGAW